MTARLAPKTRLDDCISEAMPVLLSSFGFTKREAEVAFKMSGGCIQVALTSATLGSQWCRSSRDRFRIRIPHASK